MPDAHSTVTQKIAFWIAAVIASSWLVYFVFGPTIGFDLLESWHNEQRALQVLLLVATTLCYVWLALVCSVVRIAIPFWIVFGLGVISACFSELPVHAAAEVALTVQLVLLGAFTATLVRLVPQHATTVLFSSAWIIGAVYVVGVAANYVGVIVEQRPVDLEVFILGYSNQRFASALHALILPFISWLAMNASRRSVRYSSWIIAALLWAINLAMGTRAIWAAFFLTGIAFWWQGGPVARRLVKAICVTAATGAAVYVFAWLFVPEVLPQIGAIHSRKGGLTTTETRMDLWHAAVQSIVAHPWMGIGPMHFAKLELRAGAHPHNWLLQLAAEWGIPALLVILFAAATWFRRMRVALALGAERGDGGTLPVIGISVVAAMIYGLVDGIWVMPVSQSLGVILIGVSVGLLPADEPMPSGARNAKDIAMLLAILASCATLGWYTYQTVGLQLQNEDDYVAKHRARYFLPRFWQQGIIADQEADQQADQKSDQTNQ